MQEAQTPTCQKRLAKIAAFEWESGESKIQRDIEEKLHESEARFRAVIEASNDWVWEIDLEGYYTYASPKVERLLGYTPKEVVGKTLYALMPEEEANRIAEIFKDNARRKNPFTIPENTNIHKSGAHLVVEISGVPVLDSEDNLLGWRGLTHDITERKRVEDAIRKSEERLTNIHHAVNDGIWEWDTIENKVIYASDRFLKIMGFKSKEDVSFPRWFSRIHADYRDNVIEKLKVTSQGKSVLDIEYKYRKKGNDYIWINTTGALIFNGNKEDRRIVGSVRDVTNRKMAEKEKRELQIQLQQAHKMEAIGTLAGGIAHDFNNLLQSIIINTELGLYELKNKEVDTKRLKQILKASERAKELVKQIVTFSRRGEKKQGPLKLSSLVKESLKLLRSTLPATIEVRQDIRAGNDTILADPTQMNQILMNLCTNAAHAMKKEGGVLEVGLSDVVLNDEAGDINAELNPGKYVILKVRDTGHGMEPSVIDRIFEPFFTTKDPGEGTGMGLSVVHGIVKGCKGTIVVESEPGCGATFRIYFPGVEESVALVDKSFGPLQKGEERILLVDDELFILDALKPALERLGYKVVVISDSNKALDMFKTNPHRFDIVITDYTMPHMTGVALSKKMMSLRSDIPIILCTGFSDMITEEDAKAIGIKEFLIKPLITNEIATVIRRVLDHGG